MASGNPSNSMRLAVPLSETTPSTRSACSAAKVSAPVPPIDAPHSTILVTRCSRRSAAMICTRSASDFGPIHDFVARQSGETSIMSRAAATSRAARHSSRWSRTICQRSDPCPGQRRRPPLGLSESAVGEHDDVLLLGAVAARPEGDVVDSRRLPRVRERGPEGERQQLRQEAEVPHGSLPSPATSAGLRRPRCTAMPTR